MKRFSKIILYAVAVVVASWFLPWLYALLTPSATSEPFCNFSPVTNRWVASISSPGEKTRIFTFDAFATSDSATDINAAARDSLVPHMYYRQLIAHELLADTIAGKEVSPHLLKSHEVFFNTTPRDVNRRFSGMWLMMESMPTRVELTDPDEAFRVTDDGIEFVRIADNRVNADRSSRFTKAMKARGFAFPAVDLSANVTSQKLYDEGYLMIDSEGNAFHVKQQAGRPFVAQIKMPEGVKASKVYIWEESNRQWLGLLISDAGHPYVIQAEGHTALPLTSENPLTIDPRKDAIMVMGNLFNFTMRVKGKNGTAWRAYDADSLEEIGATDYVRKRSTAVTVSRWIFPYTLSFTSYDDNFAYLRVANFSWRALPLNLLLALILLFMGIRNRDTGLKWGALATLPLGIYAFLPLILFRDR